MKRGASEYITKEHGSTPTSAEGDDKPKMSTAAQAARRKIAQPRGRLAAGRSQTSSNVTSNPFSQNPPPQQQSFGSVNGVTFGASQSFPQPSPGANSGFTFQTPQSSSFTFGAPTGTPNPFENLNGKASAAQDISMESPQKKHAPMNTFGASTGFASAQTVQQQSNPFSGFGSSQSASTNGVALFGQQAATPASLNPFGKPAESQPSFSFGQQSAPSSGTSVFGGFTPAASTSGQSPLPAFGAQQGMDTSTQPPKFVFGQSAAGTATKGSGLFGSAPSTAQKSDTNQVGFTPSSSMDSRTQPAKFNFGQSTGSTAVQGSGLFGASPLEVPGSDSNQNTFAPSQSTEPQTQPSKFVFGQSTATPQAQASSLFGSAPAATKNNNGNESGSMQPQPVSAPFSFGQPLKEAAPFVNPFANLGASKAEEPKAWPAFFSTTAATPQTSMFSSKPAGQAETSKVEEPNVLPATSSATASPPPFSGLFGKPAGQAEAPAAPVVDERTEGNAESSRATSAPKFSFGGPAQSFSSGGLFSPAKPSTENVASSGGLFKKLNSAVETSASSPSTEAKAGRPLFAASSSASVDIAGSGPGSDASESPKVTTPLFGAVQGPEAQQPQPASRPQPASPKAESTSGQAASIPGAKTGVSAASSSALVQKPSGQPSESALMLEPTKRPVYTKGPSRTPGHINAQQFQEYDRDYRLHALNHGLRQKLANLDPRSREFDNVIRHYVAARDNIGASLGLYVRNLAGTKRKGDQVDDREEEPEQNKRSREDAGQKSHTLGTSAFSMSDSVAANTPAPTSNPTTAENGTIFKPAPAAKDVASPAIGFKPTGNTTGESGSDGSSARTNPFGSFETGAFVAPDRSTTPEKSPPKKAGFEIPKFGGGGSTNFLAAFGQQAKANSDKFEKALMEKRKAEDFDSDEDDEETYRKQVEEEKRSKRAKIESFAKGGFTPTFGSVSTEDNSKPTSTGFGSASAQKTPSAPAFTGFSSASTTTGFTPLFGSSKPTVEQEKATTPFAGFGSKTSPGSFALFTSAPFGEGASKSDDDADDSEYVDDKDVEDHEASGSSNDQGETGDEQEAIDADGEEEAEDSLPEGEDVQGNVSNDDEDDDDNDLQAAMDRARKNPNAGKSLFDRIEPNPSKETPTPETNGDKDSSKETSPILQPARNSSFPPAVWGSHIGKSTPEQPAFSPFTPTTGATTAKASSTFKFTPVAPSTTPTPGPGASIFSGGGTRDGPVPGEGMFGSRPSTPSNVEKNGNLAKSVLTSPAGTDNTWKPGASISFGNGDKPTSAPTFKFTAASPGERDKKATTANPFGSLFGTPATGSSSTATPNLGFQFGTQPAAPAPGFLGAVSHLGAGSAASSAASSRATSPGLTDNESVATNETEETSDEPQSSFMESRAGEENESTLWEGRSKALMFVSTESAKGTKYQPNDWNSVGVGMIRVLKDKTSHKTRVVFRVEPSANILFNSHLIGSTVYESVPGNKSGAVRGAVMYKGNLTRLVFKLKTPEMADELANILEENKSA